MTTGALNLGWATLIMEELVRLGVRVCVLSSGARSAPLALAAAKQPGLDRVMFMDERGAAFHALGVARATQTPAVWITTSGSAAANGLPAVVEASRARVPLLLLTADRAPELRDCGANQVIDQINLFGRHVRWQCDLPCPTADISQAYVLTTVDQAVARARLTPAGPVHLNCMFREPLLPEPDAPLLALEPALTAWRVGCRPYTEYVIPTSVLPTAAVDAAWSGVRRGLVLAGELRDPAERDAALAIADRLQWPLLPDVLSGLRLGGVGVRGAPHYDLLLLDERRHHRLRPEAVLHLGGPITSRRLQDFLHATTPAHVVRAASTPERQDPGHRATHHLPVDAVALNAALCAAGIAGAGDPDWLAAWTTPGGAIAAALDAGARSAATGIDEPAVARWISRHLAPGHALFLGNSMPIRDMDMFAAVGDASPAVYAHRGASGIDGNLAGAAGVARGRGGPVTAIVGDLAALHDLNALPLLARSPWPVVLIVINNDGGGIFSFLPLARQDPAVFEACFGTPHGWTFASAAAMFGLGYARSATVDALATAYAAAVADGRSAIIEVPTERAANHARHLELQGAVVAALAGCP